MFIPDKITRAWAQVQARTAPQLEQIKVAAREKPGRACAFLAVPCLAASGWLGLVVVGSYGFCRGFYAVFPHAFSALESGPGGLGKKALVSVASTVLAGCCLGGTMTCLRLSVDVALGRPVSTRLSSYVLAPRQNDPLVRLARVGWRVSAPPAAGPR